MTDNYMLKWGLGWIDFSEEDKGKVMKVIEMLQTPGTVDELGVGVIRNSLSDAMFNGITTIQTRAKYFFIIPWILQSYIVEKVKNKTSLKYLYDEETRIMNELTWAQEDPTNQGIIGYTVALENERYAIPQRRWKQVERKPSTIYWNGLRTFGFINSQLSLSNLLKLIDKNEINIDNIGYVNGDDENGDDKETGWKDAVYFNIPYKPNWQKELCIDLNNEEASYLKHRIIDTQKDTLLAQILQNDERIKQFLKAENFESMTYSPFINDLKPETQQVLKVALHFWKILFGAHIRYNVMLQERHGSENKKIEFENKWVQWKNEMENFNWNDFDQELMWQITRKHSKVKPRTIEFINNWIEGVKEPKPTSYLDKIVEKQEKNNKEARAKLSSSNDEQYGSWTGIDEMEYRFKNVQQIIKDIAQGVGIIYD